jgi:hypothetical protein
VAVAHAPSSSDPGGYRAALYVIAMLPFCALVVVGLIDTLWQRMREGRGGLALVPSYLLVVAVALVAWLPVQDARERYRFAFGVDQNEARAEALEVVEDEVPDDAVIVVDNTYWNALVATGRDREDVVWFYKVDSDPAVIEEVVPDYESIDYLLWTREAMSDMVPVVQQAYENSDLVWSGGQFEGLVELRAGSRPRLCPRSWRTARDRRQPRNHRRRPDLHEGDNVEILVRRLAAVRADNGRIEVLFVDDSTDDTPRRVEEVARRGILPVRLLHRPAENGSAVSPVR